MTLRRWLALCGVGAGVLFAVGTVLGGPSPQDDASAAKVVSYFHDHLTVTRISSLILAIGGVLVVLFAARLRELLQSGEAGGDVLSVAAFGGAVILAGGALLDAVVGFALARAGEHRFAAPAQTLNVLFNNDFFVVTGGIAVLLLATGISTVRRPLLPRWLGWAAIVIAILSLAGPIGFLGAVLAIVWLLVVSAVIFRRDRIVT
ncbi:MAG TPA: hypothetical protein VG869_14555 [Acidimicrobiia bacterium]|jgi:hypothetical protein|nr:hypothetical protein [Acidimicrobiia bacterium]